MLKKYLDMMTMMMMMINLGIDVWFVLGGGLMVKVQFEIGCDGVCIWYGNGSVKCQHARVTHTCSFSCSCLDKWLGKCGW
jgi:hypothetical protein